MDFVINSRHVEPNNIRDHYIMHSIFGGVDRRDEKFTEFGRHQYGMNQIRRAWINKQAH